MRRSADGKWIELTDSNTGRLITLRVDAIAGFATDTPDIHDSSCLLTTTSSITYVTESYEQIAALLLGPRPAGAAGATQAQMPAANVADD